METRYSAQGPRATPLAGGHAKNHYREAVAWSGQCQATCSSLAEGCNKGPAFSAVLYSNGFVAQHNCRHEALDTILHWSEWNLEEFMYSHEYCRWCRRWQKGTPRHGAMKCPSSVFLSAMTRWNREPSDKRTKSSSWTAWLRSMVLLRHQFVAMTQVVSHL